MPFQPASVSVTDPVNWAIERTKQLLFRPFNLERWFIIGFCAWLATLGENGGFNFNYRFGSPDDGRSFREVFEQCRTFVVSNLAWIVPLAIALVILGVALGVAMLWVSSRGKFMFLHCVAHGKAEIGEPWRRFVQEGNSLFWFRLVLGLTGTVLTMPLIILAIVPVVRMVDRGAADLRGVLAVGFAVFALLGVVSVLFVIAKLTTDFVVPIMFLRRNRCLAAWNEFVSLFAVNVGNFGLYLLFQIVLGIAIGVIVVGAVLLTCCVAGCVMALPYIGTVLLLPVLTFKRAYSIHYLAQYGPEYNVFQPPMS